MCLCGFGDNVPTTERVAITDNISSTILEFLSMVNQSLKYELILVYDLLYIPFSFNLVVFHTILYANTTSLTKKAVQCRNKNSLLVRGAAVSYYPLEVPYYHYFYIFGLVCLS